MLNNRLTHLPLTRLSPQASRQPVPNDDDIPDLIDSDESGDESLPSRKSIFPETTLFSVQPSVAFPNTFQRDFDVPTGQHFSNEVLPSVNPSSSNVFESQFNSTQSPNPSKPVGPSSMRPTSPAHWSPTHVDLSQTPERVVRDLLPRGLAINSPNLTAPLFASNSTLALLPPFNEVRVHQ